MGRSFHFIAIGGAVMHQLAIFLHQQGNRITGSDDVIFDPARTQLRENGLLPEAEGWFPEKIHTGLDGVVLGMHARADNPELRRARELGVPVWSFPEFVYHRSENKRRVAIAGSHGKTTITAMVMHVLRARGMDFDYLVGSRIAGFDTMVRLTPDAPVIILESDEYLSSVIDPRPKFLHYRPEVAVISGIAWDHINVFPTFGDYTAAFRDFIATISPKGVLFYCGHDEVLAGLARECPAEARPYGPFPAREQEGETQVEHGGKHYPVKVFGRHNLENLRAAVLVVEQLGVRPEEALAALATFGGTARRLEVMGSNAATDSYLYRDFAHAPSKLRASLSALRGKYPGHRLVCVFELHTYSSLQEEFLEGYAGCLDPADDAAVFLDAEALRIKQREDLAGETIRRAFGAEIPVLRDAGALEDWLADRAGAKTVIALMSSGHFGGLDLDAVRALLNVN